MRGPGARPGRRVALACLLVLGLVRCAAVRPPPPPDAVPISPAEAGDLARRWATEWEAFPGLRAAVELTVQNRRRNDRTAAALLVAPTALRLEVAAPFGLAALVATATPDAIVVYQAVERRAFTAQPSPDAVARWLGVPLVLESLIRLLVGNVPTPADPATVRVNPTPTPHLEWTRDGTQYRVWVTAEGRPAHLLLEAPGGERLVADFVWSASGGPAEVRLVAPGRPATVTVRYLSAEFVENSPEAFRLVLPPDVPVEPLD